MNYTKFFNDEVRDKKRTASGVHHKTGKRGYVGKLYLPSDLLKGKAKREYQGTGKVKVFNMYETIMPYDEFEVLPQDAQKQYLIKYREYHSNKDIMKTWNMNHNKFYKLVNDLEIPKESRKPYTRDSKSKKRVGNMSANSLTDIKEKIITRQEESAIQVVDKKERENGMTLSLNGVYSAEELVKKLEKFILILSDEEMKFNIELKICEMA